jgi:hypothetical protein
VRWTAAVVGALGVFAALWRAWYGFGWLPSGADRLAVALPVAAVVSAALSGPLFAWAGRERPAVAVRSDQAELEAAVIIADIQVNELKSNWFKDSADPNPNVP